MSKNVLPPLPLSNHHLTFVCFFNPPDRASVRAPTRSPFTPYPPRLRIPSPLEIMRGTRRDDENDDGVYSSERILVRAVRPSARRSVGAAGCARIARKIQRKQFFQPRPSAPPFLRPRHFPEITRDARIGAIFDSRDRYFSQGLCRELRE